MNQLPPTPAPCPAGGPVPARRPTLLDPGILSLALRDNPEAEDVLRLILETITGEVTGEFTAWSLDAGGTASVLDSQGRFFLLKILDDPAGWEIGRDSETPCPDPGECIRGWAISLSPLAGPALRSERLIVPDHDLSRLMALPFAITSFQITRVLVCSAPEYPREDLHLLMDDFLEPYPGHMHFALLGRALSRVLSALSPREAGQI